MISPRSGFDKSPREAAPIDRARAPDALRLGVHALGTIAFLGYVAMTLLSYTQAAALWHTVSAPRAQAFFQELANSLRLQAPALAGWLEAGQWPADNVHVLVVHCATLGVATLACAGLLGLLSRYNSDVRQQAVVAVRRWAVAFMAVSFFAYPVFTQDFWLSALWGRMIAEGGNPYYQLFTDADLGNLPLDHFPMPMSYGPLWGLLSAAVMLISGNNLVAAAILFKLILIAAWWGCLWCAGRIVETEAPGHQAATLAVLGWMPAGVVQTVAEGHNDAVMAALSLLWLLLLIHNRRAAPIALVASVLCKFASLPLALVELIVLGRREKSYRDRMKRVAGPALVGVGVMALFYRSPAFFDGIRMIDGWHFLRPHDAIKALGEVIGIPLDLTAAAVSVAFPLVAARQLTIAYREPSDENLVTGSIAVMAAVLFGAIGHVWPWYLIWGLSFAALKPSWWVSRLIIAVALVMPFALVSWWVEELDGQRDLIAFGIYAFAVACVVASRKRHVPGRSSMFGRSADA